MDKRELINQHTESTSINLLKIIVGFYIAAARCGILKKSTSAVEINHSRFYEWVEQLTLSIRSYHTYITYGFMPPIDIPQITDANNCFMNIMRACKFDGNAKSNTKTMGARYKSTHVFEQHD